MVVKQPKKVDYDGYRLALGNCSLCTPQNQRSGPLGTGSDALNNWVVKTVWLCQCKAFAWVWKAERRWEPLSLVLTKADVQA